ncbi:glycoside hydrolase family 3 N-terminal domain-containing protein [Enterococcus sp. BWR-S5]|uniref:glycoside hydrolase family 3 N-terminal domain-containing protein n=1 Tax=Enterococcus sp. BWR-S5 TaxID=2787714 RepID=UPI001F0046E5|nr:glycoside hydrolase family 3 N-terminal domain-containing protein [Enterococcus sp. BWR-S5]
MSYKNPDRTIHERVEDLLKQMTVEEKVGQVNQHLYGWKAYEKDKTGFRLTDYFKEHVRWGQGMGALYGLFRADPWSKVNQLNGIPAEDSWKVANDIQDYVINHSRLGIPVLLAEECPHGHQGLGSISYPTNIGRGNSFNTSLIEETSRLMAEELAAKGVHLALVSSLDLSRDPRWGRTEECYGEDPYVAAAFNRSIIAGFQGDMINDHQAFVHQTVAEIDRKPNQLGVVLKHCIAQGDGLGGHNSGAVTIGQREFMEIYYPLLNSAKNAAGIMAAYNDIDGVPCHTNQQLFQEQLRTAIGYQGIVMADGTALDRLKPIYGSDERAAGQALQAGIDLSLWDRTYLTIENGLKQGVIQMEALDQAVYRILSLKFMLGLFDRPFTEKPETNYKERIYCYQKGNQKMAAESMTLLKNEGLLPLTDSGEKLAVIGPNAHALYNQLGDYTAPQTDEQLGKTIFTSVKQAFSRSQVAYSQGCDVRDEQNQETLIENAVELAEKSDKIILVLGGSSARNFDMEFFANGAVSSKGVNMDSGENVDVASLSLGGKQLELLARLKATEKPIITILVQGRPHDIETVCQHSAAVISAWYPGQEGGLALAQILTGTVNPSGKLSISYPRSSGQLPVYHYQRDIAMNENYYDLSGAPLFPFGYGESFTTFSYEKLTVLNPEVTKQALKDGKKLQVEVTVKNTGQYIGKETALLFVKLHGGDVIQRKQLLRGFEKVELSPNQAERISFKLGVEELAYCNSQGAFELTDQVTIRINELEQLISFENS